MISIIENTVERMREYATITNIVDNANGTYTVTADPESLTDNDYITITNTTGFNNDYRVSSVTGTGFNITQTTGTAIPGSFGIWTAKAPYFMADRLTEITRILTDKAQDNTALRYQRFPLIVLIIPVGFTEDEKAKTGIIETESFDIYFFVETEGDSDNDARRTLNYSTLETLSDLFNKELSYTVTNDMLVRKEWNPDTEGREYIFTEPVDAWINSYNDLELKELCENL